MEQRKCKVCGELINLNTRRRTYCSKECAEKAQRQKVKEKYQAGYNESMEYRMRLNAELKEIRKKSTLDKDIKHLAKNAEKLGLKSYDYGKYAHLKGL